MPPHRTIAGRPHQPQAQTVRVGKLVAARPASTPRLALDREADERLRRDERTSPSAAHGIISWMTAGTTSYKREHGLTIKQLNALDLLIQGETDAATADAVGVNRVTVTKWRNYDAYFQAELNRRRLELWGASVDRLRSLLPRALDALDDELRGGQQRWRAAIEILRLTGLDRSGAKKTPLESYLVGSTSTDAIIDGHVRARRPDPMREIIDGGPITEDERIAVRTQLDQELAGE